MILSYFYFEGDHALKNVGVIADPEITNYSLKDSDKFLIIASDGVWEFITSQVRIINAY